MTKASFEARIHGVAAVLSGPLLLYTHITESPPSYLTIEDSSTVDRFLELQHESDARCVVVGSERRDDGASPPPRSGSCGVDGDGVARGVDPDGVRGDVGAKRGGCGERGGCDEQRILCGGFHFAPRRRVYRAMDALGA